MLDIGLERDLDREVCFTKRVEKGKLLNYRDGLYNKLDVAAKWGNLADEVNTHTLNIDGINYVYKHTGWRQVAYKSDLISFDYIKYRGRNIILPNSIRLYNKKGEEFTRDTTKVVYSDTITRPSKYWGYGF